MYKSIIKAVVVSAVAAFFCVGCGGGDNGTGTDPDNPNNPDNPGNGGGGGGGLVGDWEILEEWYERYGDSGIAQIPDYVKAFYSFTSSNDARYTVFTKVDDFLVEDYDYDGKYSIKGNSVCFEARYNEENEEEYCMNYKISGSTLTLSGSYCEEYWDGECMGYEKERTTATKSNIATFKSSNKVYSRDPKLKDEWVRPSESRSGEDEITFYSFFTSCSFWDCGGVYTGKGNCNGGIHWEWYTEGSVLTLATVICSEYKGIGRDRECTSQTVTQSVQLDYQISNNGKTLSLRPAGSSAWDEWTLREDYMYKSKAKARQEKGDRAVSPFFKDFRR